MKVEIEEKKEVQLTTLQVRANVPYWEDSEVNGEPDTEDGDNIPCKEGNLWMPLINIDTGQILNWEAGKTASIHYKVVDECGWELYGDNGNAVLSAEDGYVPKTLCPKENGYGDYIIMDIDENGFIANWRFNIDDFISDDED